MKELRNCLVCVKPVPDPDTLNALALNGSLKVDPSTASLELLGVPLIVNGYDAQAVEAALRLKDEGLDLTVQVVCVAPAAIATPIVRNALALGASEATIVDTETAAIGSLAVAQLIAVQAQGADLVMCGQQSSDTDQGLVPSILAGLLDVPYISQASSISVDDDGVIVFRSAGDRIQARCPTPAVISVSSEIGEPRYPTTASMLAARKAPIAVISPVVPSHSPWPVTRLETVLTSKTCQFVTGNDVEEVAVGVRDLLTQLVSPWDTYAGARS